MLALRLLTSDHDDAEISCTDSVDVGRLKGDVATGCEALGLSKLETVTGLLARSAGIVVGTSVKYDDLTRVAYE